MNMTLAQRELEQEYWARYDYEREKWAATLADLDAEALNAEYEMECAMEEALFAGEISHDVELPPEPYVDDGLPF
jgi:hypothetical protein